MLLTRFLILLLLLAGGSLSPASAQPRAELEHTTVTLIAESNRPASGKSVTLGFVMTPKPGWHTYWKNPGDSGIETRAAWTLPAGVTASDIRYPTPETFVVAGLMNYVYGHENILLVDLKLPEGLAPGSPLPVRVKLDWLVCDDELCVPESATLSTELVIGDGSPDQARNAKFAKARAAMPKPVSWPARFAFQGDSFALAVPFAQTDSVTSAYFFPLTDGALAYAAPQEVGRNGETLRIATKAEYARDLKQIDGILKVTLEGRDDTLSFALTAKPGSVPATATPLIAATSGSVDDRGGDTGTPTAAVALLLAIVGGLLLNVMPCVFPILSLKALSLARGGTSEAEARHEAVAYAVGVILTCLMLGGLILGLRAAGVAAGWAFQLQDPRVILVLLLLMVAIALNLSGLYEINLSTRGAGQSLVAKGGTGGAFWTGVLAAFVATPCTGPFMGVALGAAVVLPPAIGLLIFAGLGLGLALPFLLLGFVPMLRRLLPRPGPWMATFRRLLSLPMFLTALGLAWVLGRQTGVSGMTLGLAASLGLAFALWWLGQRQQSGQRPSPVLRLAPIALAAAACIGALLTLQPADAVKPAAAALGGSAPADLAAEAFTPARLDALRSAGKPAFVYFTADWCITCKVNERGAMADADVIRAFKQAGITVLVGDWTNGDSVISRFLESHGRSGVPLYLFYTADGRVELLPQLLTADKLIGLASSVGRA